MRELGHDLVSLEDARETMLSLIGAIDAEPCATTEAFARVLRQAVEARDLIPPFDNSAMDGYAVHAADLAPAGEENPVTLPVAFRLRAGEAATETLARLNAALEGQVTARFLADRFHKVIVVPGTPRAGEERAARAAIARHDVDHIAYRIGSLFHFLDLFLDLLDLVFEPLERIGFRRCGEGGRHEREAHGSHD